MPKTLSDHYREQAGASAGDAPVTLLEISHPQLAQPIRVVDDTVDLVSNGDTFVACGFRVAFPDEVASQVPRCAIAIDNIGRELTQWLEGSNGGRGAQVRLMEVMRDTPDVIERDYTLDLVGVKQSVTEVTGSLGYEDTLNLPGLAETYRPENTPALF